MENEAPMQEKPNRLRAILRPMLTPLARQYFGSGGPIYLASRFAERNTPGSISPSVP